MNFLRDLTHVRQVFPPAPGPRAAQIPVEYSDLILPVFDILGTHRYREATVEAATSALNASSIDGPSSVPAGRIRYVFYAHVFHGDAAATHTLWITAQILNLVGGSNILKVSPHATVANTTPVELPRPIILPPGSNLEGRSADAVGAANTLTVEYYFVDVPVGERIVTP